MWAETIELLFNLYFVELNVTNEGRSYESFDGIIIIKSITMIVRSFVYSLNNICSYHLVKQLFAIFDRCCYTFNKKLVIVVYENELTTYDANIVMRMYDNRKHRKRNQLTYNVIVNYFQIFITWRRTVFVNIIQKYA